MALMKGPLTIILVALSVFAVALFHDVTEATAGSKSKKASASKKKRRVRKRRRRYRRRRYRRRYRRRRRLRFLRYARRVRVLPLNYRWQMKCMRVKALTGALRAKVARMHTLAGQIEKLGNKMGSKGWEPFSMMFGNGNATICFRRKLPRTSRGGR